jgi:serine/threonine protein kinase
MAPEQAFGNADVDGRTDLYSLACVFYEMLTGKPPYLSDTALGVIKAHAFDVIPSGGRDSSRDYRRPSIPSWRAPWRRSRGALRLRQEFLDALDAGHRSRASRSLRKRAERSCALRPGAWAPRSLPRGDRLSILSSPGAGCGRAGTGDRAGGDRTSRKPYRRPDSIRSAAWRDLITEGLHRRSIVDVVPSATALQAAADVASWVPHLLTPGRIRSLRSPKRPAPGRWWTETICSTIRSSSRCG